MIRSAHIAPFSDDSFATHALPGCYITRFVYCSDGIARTGFATLRSIKNQLIVQSSNNKTKKKKKMSFSYLSTDNVEITIFANVTINTLNVRFTMTLSGQLIAQWRTAIRFHRTCSVALTHFTITFWNG